MPRPARSCATAAPRTPTAPRSTPAAWWGALLRRFADAGGLDDVEAISVGGSSTAWSCSTPGGRVIRDALLWNDTRSARAARDLIAEVGAASRARARASCRSRRSR